MAELRIALLAVTLAVACDPAAAQAPVASGITAPAGWQSLPELAAAVTAAATGPGASVLGSEAWGETSRGCYAVWFAIVGGPTTADQIIAGLAGATIESRDVVKPTTPDGPVTAMFARGEYRGRLRARIAGDRVTALACFANQREPAICDRACEPVLGALK
ncbi:MAG: hypothetical protein AB7O24_15265 [Kofleriaceae bacterium]